MNNQSARINMIKQQLRTGGVLNEDILNLYSVIPRHEFVPEHYAHFAYSDMQIPLDHHQKMLTPLEEGKILQALNLKGHETVLEIGTGTGFLTALLSKQCKEVLSIDYYPEFTAYAGRQLQKHQCQNVQLITADGSRGWLENAPYEVVLIGGSIKQLDQTHFLQVIPGGSLIAIEGASPVMKAYLYQIDKAEVWQKKLLFETNTPALVNQLQADAFVF